MDHHFFCLFASVAELADALDLGSSAFGVQVRLLSLAPLVLMHPLGCFFFVTTKYQALTDYNLTTKKLDAFSAAALSMSGVTCEYVSIVC